MMRHVFKVLLLLIPVLFVASLGAQPAFAAEQVEISDKSPAGELAYWNSIKDSSDVGQFKTYLENFSNGMFYDVALAKYKELGGAVADLKPMVGNIEVGKSTPKTTPKPMIAKRVAAKTQIKKPAMQRKITYRATPKRVIKLKKRITLKKINKPQRIAKYQPPKGKKPAVNAYDPINSNQGSGAGNGGNGGNSWSGP